MDCSSVNICWYPKYWTKNMNSVKPSPVKPPIIHPFAFPFTPAIIPPINNEIKPMTKVTQDNVGSLNVVKRSNKAKAILAIKMSPKTTSQPYINAINCCFFIKMSPPEWIVHLYKLIHRPQEIDEKVMIFKMKL